MSNSTGISGPITVHVSSRSTLVDSMQEITLRAALSNAIRLMAECFDNGNRGPEPGSVFSRQAAACEQNYAVVSNHKTTFVYTENMTKHLISSGLDYLKGATDTALATGSGSRWSSQSLTRSLIEAAAECLWLADPTLDCDTRIRRTNQMLVRTCDEMLRVLPDRQESLPRFLSIDPAARTVCLDTRDGALEWASAQGWTCQNGKAITRARWIAEIPTHTDMVALTAQGTMAYWKDVYRTLSGVTHSQPLLATLSLSSEPESLLDRALMVLDMGISFYTDALHRFAEFMGWHDHEIETWFAPVHLAVQHLRTPEDIPLPRIETEQCNVCPEYHEPYMHRLAFASHICALMERHVNESLVDAKAPTRYAAAMDFFDTLHGNLAPEADTDSNRQEILTSLGTGHTAALALYGAELREVFTSIAASWAILRSSSYQSNIGRIQGWRPSSNEQLPTTPGANG